MKNPKIVVTDNTHQYMQKEIKRLFPDGDVTYIWELLMDKQLYDGMNFNGSAGLKPRKFKEEYQAQ